MQVYYVGPPGSSFSHFSDLMQRRRVLYSYATCRYDTVPEGAAGYCLDSGAFTVWKKGKTIEMERLLRWYEQRDTADFKFALDVIGGDEADQRRNLRIMEIEGHDVERRVRCVLLRLVNRIRGFGATYLPANRDKAGKEARQERHRGTQVQEAVTPQQYKGTQ